jgi:small GTP-binding protein
MASAPSDLYDYLFKLIIIGDSGVGKSSILTRYMRNEFTDEAKTTIGVELSTSLIEVNDKRVKVAIWDTAGQERFRAATNLYYRNTLGAFICYDITNYASFKNVEKWLTELSDHVHGQVIVTLVGNKCDLARRQRAVTQEEAQLLAEKHNLDFVETSALDATNIESSFKQIISNIYNRIYKTDEENEYREGAGEEDGKEKGNELDSSPASSNSSNKINVNLTLAKSDGPSESTPVKFAKCCNVN